MSPLFFRGLNPSDMTDYEAILESISDGVFTVDQDWKITSFNRAAESITGVSREDAIGRSCSDVLRSSLCGSQCALRKTLSEGIPLIDKRCYFIDQQGEEVPISLSTALFRSRSGEIIGGAETFRDLSPDPLLVREKDSPGGLGYLKSVSPSMEKVFQILSMVADTDSTMMILGETGTGKELTARTLHEMSGRKEEPFVAVNCAALPETLLESILFGHVRGAFTGAVQDKQGIFARAGRGTLFLDEIGDISPALQLRLLRVLQEQTYEPLGGTEAVKTEARILTATHRDLKEEIRKGTFREDLYYRLNVVSVELPPLRSRPEDIPYLTELFLERFSLHHNRDVESLTPEALRRLLEYSWPGNIRELENVIERACLLCPGKQVSPDCLPPELTPSGEEALPEHSLLPLDNPPQIEKTTGSDSEDSPDVPVSLKGSLETAEILKIRQALVKSGYNKLAAARLLGIHKTTLFRKMKKYHIDLQE